MFYLDNIYPNKTFSFLLLLSTKQANMLYNCVYNTELYILNLAVCEYVPFVLMNIDAANSKYFILQCN